MRGLHSIMCFSSCIICLLIVAGHGSPVPGHDGVVSGRGSEPTLHPRRLPSDKPADLKSQLHTSHQQRSLVKGNHHSQKDESSNFIVDSSVIAQKPREVERKKRSRDMSPVPIHLESQSSYNSSKSAHNDSLPERLTSSSVLESSKQSDLHPHRPDHLNHGDISLTERHEHDRSPADHGIHPMSRATHLCSDHEDSHLDEGNQSFQSKAAPLADHHQHYPTVTRTISGYVWLYASIAVVVISLCGLLSVAIIPIMQKWFYHTLLQFLVGLAIGSLSGDGLLHLMPHAILDGVDIHDHDGEHSDLFDPPSGKEMEKTAIWRGLAALGGIFLFFIAERLLGAFTLYRRQKMEAKFSRHSKKILPVVQLDEDATNGNVGDKLAQPTKNSYDHIKEKDEKETIQMLETEPTSPVRKGSGTSTHEVGFHGRSSFSIDPELAVACRPDSESSVIVSEHHGHNHGHSHDIPQSVSAVAWMVIMGDGLHNFCDGLAIGAAFASGDADGISTTVAVFCHELPHELGDFAMLLKTGMKVKQALFYNGLSSILCFVGMIIGVLLGNVTSATRWVFSGTAGMFLYIALVDMLPELSTGSGSGLTTVITLVVQVIGIFMGITIMLLIALYEHQLHTIVS